MYETAENPIISSWLEKLSSSWLANLSISHRQELLTSFLYVKTYSPKPKPLADIIQILHQTLLYDFPPLLTVKTIIEFLHIWETLPVVSISSLLSASRIIGENCQNQKAKRTFYLFHKLMVSRLNSFTKHEYKINYKINYRINLNDICGSPIQNPSQD